MNGAQFDVIGTGGESIVRSNTQEKESMIHIV